MIDALASLVDKSLVALDASGSGGVYRLLDTTRAYAREKLARSGEQDRVSRRHAEHARTLLLAAREIGAPSDARSIDDVRVALDWAFAPQGDEALGLKLTSAAIPLWFQLSLIDECFQRVQRALEIAEIAGDREAQLSTLYGLWNCRFLSSEFRECVSLAQRLSRSFLRGAVLSWAIGLTIYAFWTYLDV